MSGKQDLKVKTPDQPIFNSNEDDDMISRAEQLELNKMKSLDT